MVPRDGFSRTTPQAQSVDGVLVAAQASVGRGRDAVNVFGFSRGEDIGIQDLHSPPRHFQEIAGIVTKDCNPQ